MKILIIDDSKSVAEVIDLMLTDIEIELLWAANGQDGIDILKREQNIDLILLDWHMPIMNGDAFLKAIENEKMSRCPVLLMSIDSTNKNMIDKSQKYIIEYIIKPFTKKSLVDKIKNVVNNIIINKMRP
ncbi:MAG: response regulator [Oligoflexia bacterium]|nr:response regulator [Oligoflexia bacterium]